MKNKKNQKLALVSPRASTGKNMIRRVQPPLGLISLAAVLEEKGYKKVEVYDALIENYDNVQPHEEAPDTLITFGASNDEIINKLKFFQPDLIGVSSLFSSQVSQAFSFCRDAKKAFPEVPVVLGGIHASDKCIEIMTVEPSIDYIVTGEGDYTFVEFVEHLFGDGNIESVGGMVWRENGEIKKNPRPAFNHEMDKLPFPAWHKLPMKRYFEIAMYHNPYVKSERVACIMTSRGCPDKCYFCASTVFFGHRFRAMSPDRVAEMVDYLVTNWDIKELEIEDDNFTVNPKRVIDICERIKHHGLRLTMPNAMRADAPINRDKRQNMLAAMKNAGWEQIGLGVEHGDNKFLNEVINKRLNLDEVIATTEMAQNVGLLVHCNFMMGFPHETQTQRQKTIDFAMSLNADSYSLSLATPLPGTDMWDIMEKEQLFTENFDHDRGLPGLVSIKPDDIGEQELLDLVEKVNRDLNIKASNMRKIAKEKYSLFKGKTAVGDRKFLDEVAEPEIIKTTAQVAVRNLS